MPSPVRGLSWKRLSRRFRTPLRTATGEYATRDSLILRLVDESGRVGYGEVAPWPGFPVETLDDAGAELKALMSNDAGFSSPACALASVPAGSPFAFENRSTPCLDAALSHAREWAASGWGERAVALPCAKLLRGCDDVAGLENFPAAKLKIGAGGLRDEQRAVAGLIRRCGPDTRLRLDANGSLDAGKCAAWCDFLGGFPEIEWLEQPMSPGREDDMLAIARRSGVADRLAFDESVAGAKLPEKDFPGIVVVKPLFAGDLAAFRTRRAALASDRIAYSSVFSSPFGRQAALGVAGESPGPHAVGFDTLGVFDDDLDIHEPGPVAKTVSRDPAFWEALWARI